MSHLYILGTIHQTHEKNPNYGFYHILEEVRKFSPHILCVEIRAQDMKETNSYLKEYYPPEMVLLKEKYEDQVPVLGFDWRGDSMENRRIGDKPQDHKDIFSLFEKDALVHDLIVQRKEKMAPYFNTCTLQSCQADYCIYNEKIKEIEEQLERYLCENGFQELVDYNTDRELKIQENLKQVIAKNSSKRIMIITGISHKEKLEQALKNL